MYSNHQTYYTQQGIVGFKSFYSVNFYHLIFFNLCYMVSIFLLYLSVKRATGLLEFLYYFVQPSLNKAITYLLTYLPFQSFLSFSSLGLLVSSLGGVIETNSELTSSIWVKMEDTSFFFSLSNQCFKSWLMTPSQMQCM